jgi:hypothetical protein
VGRLFTHRRSGSCDVDTPVVAPDDRRRAIGERLAPAFPVSGCIPGFTETSRFTSPWLTAATPVAARLRAAGSHAQLVGTYSLKRSGDQMAAIVLYDWNASFWRSASEWLDRMAATTYENHREVIEMVHTFEDLDYELWQVSTEVTEVTALGALAAHDLYLRLEDIEMTLRLKWSHPKVRASAEQHLRSLHERFLGPVTDEQEVVYSVFDQLAISDVHAYVQSTRQLWETRLEERVFANDRPGSRGVTVVRTPLWAHRVLALLASDTPLGVEMFTELTVGEHPTFRDTFDVTAPSAPCFGVDDDLLQAALALWTPEDRNSTYQEFVSAVAAARLL